MTIEVIKQEILRKIQHAATANGGRAPGIERFESDTGIKRHVWLGKIWRNWKDAVTEAGFSPNELQGAISDSDLLRHIYEMAKSLGRFPTTSDIHFELHQRDGGPNSKTVLRRWKMHELATALAEYADALGDTEIAVAARAYVPLQRKRERDSDRSVPAPGYVYVQRHGTDYKIGYTTSLNKRGRQIQIELPQEIELVHSILTDDPVGVEAYWHKRFAAKRTRGEWFKLTKADVAAFKRWSKIW